MRAISGKEANLLKEVYYELKPLFPRSMQIAFRRYFVSRSARRYRHIWPIHPAAGSPPVGWSGWPDKKRFAFVLTHDVDTVTGEERCPDLMDVDRELGFRSAFYFIPGRVRKSAEIIPELKRNGFEVGVHDLFHDGKLFRSKEVFQKRAIFINRYLSKWEAAGFRAGAMHHNLEWLHDLDILYDASTFDVDPFEPQPDGMTTIFPFAVKPRGPGKGYVELPYTLPQDFTLFVIMREKSIDIWKKKLEWIAARGGMALVITHPDYMNFGGRRLAFDEYHADLYREFLTHVNHEYGHQFWNALPSEIAEHWVRNESNLRC